MRPVHEFILESIPPIVPILGLGLASALVLGGCETVQSTQANAGAKLQPLAEISPPPDLQYSNQVDESQAEPESPSKKPDDLWQRMRAGFVLWDVDHARIQYEISRLQRTPEVFTRFVERGRPYLYHLLSETQKRDLPSEIALIPAIESGFHPQAKSRVGAAGLWQFMPGTGRYRGLTLDWWYDGRLDVVDATEAALDYLEYLHKQVGGDWLNTFASYNAGAGTVLRAQRYNRSRNRPTDYWSLRLPGETKSYVPRLLALAAVISDPERYGLSLPDIPNRPYFEIVAIPGQIDLAVAGELAETDPAQMLLLNPGHKRWCTHPEGPNRLLIPKDKVVAFERNLAKLPADQQVRWRRYQVKAGDTLGHIARRHQVSVDAIKRVNGLHSHLIRAGRDLLLPIRAETAAIRKSGKAIKVADSESQATAYRVRTGDSLSVIALNHGVTVAQLCAWNGLRSDKAVIRAGQLLHIRSGNAQPL